MCTWQKLGGRDEYNQNTFCKTFKEAVKMRKKIHRGKGTNGVEEMKQLFKRRNPLGPALIPTSKPWSWRQWRHGGDGSLGQRNRAAVSEPSSPIMLNPLDTAALKGGWLSFSASGVGIIGHSCIKESGLKLHASYESKLSKGHRTNG